MVNKNAPDLTIEDATLRWRNFSGVAKKFNRLGDRNFHVVLDREDLLELVPALEDDGWNLTFDNRNPEDQEEGWEPRHPSIQCAVRYDRGPKPKIVTITTDLNGKQRGRPMTEATVESLDWARISKVDIVIHPSYWEANGNNGLKAYVKTMFITLDEDDIERKYAFLFDNDDDDDGED